jgi:D-alanine transaminase
VTALDAFRQRESRGQAAVQAGPVPLSESDITLQQSPHEVTGVLCYLNGQILPRSTASIPVEDRGFIFGDGVYEVWRVVNGRLFEMDRHLDRLRFGLSELRIQTPELCQGDTLQRVADTLLNENGHQTGEATVYVEVTRGVAPRTHQFPAANTAPTAFMMTNAFTPPHDLRAQGTSAITVDDIRWLRCDLKTIQLLPNVLAKQAAAEQGATECVLVRNGFVTEGSHSNLMAVVDGELRTHPLGNLILPGITRAVVLELARSLGIPVREEAIEELELPQIEELFLTGTTTDVMPIVQLNDRHVGSGVPGPITTRLYQAFRAHLDAACAPVAAGVAR